MCQTLLATEDNVTRKIFRGAHKLGKKMVECTQISIGW